MIDYIFLTRVIHYTFGDLFPEAYKALVRIGQFTHYESHSLENSTASFRKWVEMFNENLKI